MAKFQMTVVLEIPDNKPEIPDSPGFLPKTALETMDEDMPTDREECVSAAIVSFAKLEVTTTHRRGATTGCLPFSHQARPGFRKTGNR
jgi:hypothetical protein